MKTKMQKYFGAICGILITLCWAFSATTVSALDADVYEVDNTPAQSLARPLLNDGAQDHTIHVTNDIDYVHCLVSTGHIYRFETYGLDASLDTYIYLVASDGTTVLAEDDDSGVDLGSLIEYPVSATGTNYVLIEDYWLNHGAHATGAYSIVMTDLGESGTAGTRKWQKEFAGIIYSSPAIGADGKIYLGLPDGRLCAFNPDGSTSKVWNAGAAVIYSVPAIAADSTIYMGSLDSKLYAFNPDGTTGHIWQTGAAIAGSPAIGPDGRIYIGSLDNKLYGFNADGTTGHVWTTQNSIWSSPVISSDGSIYIGSFDMNFYGFNPDGTTNHVWKLDNIIQYASPAIDTNGNIYIGTTSGSLYSFNPNGTTNHVWNTSVAIMSSPTIGADGKIYLGLQNGKFCAFNPDGTTGQVWNAGPMYSAPLLGSDGSIYACGELTYSFKSDGTTNWYSSGAASVFGGPAMDTNGVLYVVAQNKFNAIYATGSLARTVWPKYAHDLKNTGMVSPAAPTNVVATDGLYNDKVRVNWTPALYASSYDILRSITNSYASALVCGSSATTNYNDTNAIAGITYYYWVQTRNNSGISIAASPYDIGWRASRADPVIVSASGGWYVWFSGSGYQRGGPWNLGVSGTPVAGDFDGDGYTDPAVVDNAGNWYVWLTSMGYQRGGPFNLSVSGTPLAADFDGDGYTDPAVVDNAGIWYAWYTSLGYQMVRLWNLGVSGTPLAADFDGDGYADLVIVDNAGAWYAWFSSTGYQMGGPYNLGVSGTPLAADFDGDRYADPAVVDNTGAWRVWYTSLGYQMGGPWSLGVLGTPLAADFDGQ